ncbi:MAG: hypothetical protein O3A01_03550 [bacterium]|nr:hypothetical protein [bacterium]
MHFFELGVGLILTSLILGLGIGVRLDSDAQRCRNAGQLVGEFLLHQRTAAIVSKADRGIDVVLPNGLVVSESGETLNLRGAVVFESYKRVGFKPDGRTKYANSLTLKCGGVTQRITVGVGYGRVRVL